MSSHVRTARGDAPCRRPECARSREERPLWSTLLLRRRGIRVALPDVLRPRQVRLVDGGWACPLGRELDDVGRARLRAAQGAARRCALGQELLDGLREEQLAGAAPSRRAEAAKPNALVGVHDERLPDAQAQEERDVSIGRITAQLRAQSFEEVWRHRRLPTRYNARYRPQRVDSQGRRRHRSSSTAQSARRRRGRAGSLRLSVGSGPSSTEVGAGVSRYHSTPAPSR